MKSQRFLVFLVWILSGCSQPVIDNIPSQTKYLQYDIILVIISFLALLGAGIIMVSCRVKIKNNKLLSKQSKKIQEQNNLLEERARQLKELDLEKDNFLSLVAHDLKSPLTKIQGLANLINATGSLSEEQKGYLTLMGRISNDARSLIENILELSLLESGKLIIQTEEIKIHEMLGNIIEEYQDIANQKNISLAFEAKDEFTATTNLELCKRVVDNLLSNAIKFSPNGKTVTINCLRENAEYFQLSVKDEGPGIKQNEKENLFKKYQKLSAKPTAGESSTGLGLAIVKLLVDYLKGSIEVITAENQGSTFIVILPLTLSTTDN